MCMKMVLDFHKLESRQVKVTLVALVLMKKLFTRTATSYNASILCDIIDKQQYNTRL